MNEFYRYSSRAARIGDGTAEGCVAYLESYVRVLFPGNGIEYWAAHLDRPGATRLPLPGDYGVHHVASYVRPGNCEGNVIEIALSMQQLPMMPVASPKASTAAPPTGALPRPAATCSTSSTCTACCQSW